RTQGGHLWWRRSADGGSVCIGTVIMWVQYNTTAAKTWQVTIYSARHPAGLIVASRTFSLKRGWYWWGFGVHQYYQGLHAVCVSATESFGMSCVDFSGPAGLGPATVRRLAERKAPEAAGRKGPRRPGGRPP